MARELTGIMVRVLDIEKVMADKGYNLRPCQEIGIVKTVNGTYLLDSEGVGQADTLEVEAAEIYLCPPGDFPTPSHTIRITSDMASSCPHRRIVDLAEFIRVFGRRLEENFEAWRETLKEAQ